MSKRILINATPAGEVWATFVENGTLEELFVESSRKQVMRGNIYRAHVTSIDNKLRAAFIDYGTERNGFISIKEVHPSAYHRTPRNQQDFQVSEVLQVGQPLLVQLKKEEDGGKGAAFTTDVTLASSYTVISPVSGGDFTMSRKITDAKVKRAFKAMMKQFYFSDQNPDIEWLDDYCAATKVLSVFRGTCAIQYSKLRQNEVAHPATI